MNTDKDNKIDSHGMACDAVARGLIVTYLKQNNRINKKTIKHQFKDFRFDGDEVATMLRSLIRQCYKDIEGLRINVDLKQSQYNKREGVFKHLKDD